MRITEPHFHVRIVWPFTIFCLLVYLLMWDTSWKRSFCGPFSKLIFILILGCAGMGIMEISGLLCLMKCTHPMLAILFIHSYMFYFATGRVADVQLHQENSWAT